MMRRLIFATLMLLFTASAFANDVVVQVKNGGLVIKGDDDANTLQVDQNGLGEDSVRITPGGGTTVNGAGGAQVFPGLAGKGAKILLGDGADVIALASLTLSGKVVIKGATGSDRITLSDATFRDPVTIDAGTGDNAVLVCSATFQRDVVVKLGKGTNGSVAQVTCGTGSTSTVDASAVVFGDDAFGGNVTVKGAAAGHILGYNDSTTAGSIAIKNVALVGVCYNTIGGALNVKLVDPPFFSGGIDCGTGSFTASAAGNAALAMAGTTVGGPFTIKTGAGDDSVVLVGTPIGGALTASLGAGNNFLFFFAVQAASLKAKAGADADDLISEDVTIAGDGSVKYGNGPNTIDFKTSVFGGDLTVKTGKNGDVIHASGATAGGSKSIDSGKGNDVVD
ncbi:MAG: hypothetical protein ABIR79_23130 [Candidatus Binatia bacterium]